MNPSPCENLDDYLADRLSADEAARFEAHLADCSACGEETADQQRIDRLLARGAGHLEPVPSSLVDRIEGQVRAFRRRRAIRTGLGLSAAVAVALCVGLWLLPQDDGTPPAPATRPAAPSIAEETIQREPHFPAAEEEAAPPSEPAAESARRVRVSLADPSEAILVRVPSSKPNVSIVWIYPTMKPGRAAAEPAAVPP